MRPFVTHAQISLAGSASLFIALLYSWAYFQTWPFAPVALAILLPRFVPITITQKHRHVSAGVLLIGPLANAGGLPS